MRIGLLTESGYPYASGEARGWCDRLVRGLTSHAFEVYALSRDAEQEARGWDRLPARVQLVRTAPLWGELSDEHRWWPPGTKARGGRRGGAAGVGRRDRQRFAEHFADLTAAFCAAPGAAGEERPEEVADRFANGLYGLADLARDTGALPGLLRSERAVRMLEAACRAPGALPAAHPAQVPDLLLVTEALEVALRPLSLDWYGDHHTPGLGGVDLCHATSSGAAALAGLLAKRFFGTPLLVTEYGVRLREHYLARTAEALSAPVRALMAAFEGALAAETYRRAELITPGNTHTRRWQERCGAPRERLRTVYPGMDAGHFAQVPDAAADGGKTLMWIGAIEPAKDLIALLHAFAQVRRAEPDATLRIVGSPGADPEAPAYLAHCRALAAQLFPDEAADAVTVGENPVSFEQIGDPEVPSLADAYEAGTVLVLSSVVEGFPRTLVEAMFCGRATVSTDVGAVCEVIGGTGLVVPPRNPRALAEACAALLGDPERRARLGAAARARALELFTVEQNIGAFRGIYLELMSHAPAPRTELDEDGAPHPFARPAEAHLPGHWAAAPVERGHTPSWARPEGATEAADVGGAGAAPPVEPAVPGTAPVGASDAVQGVVPSTGLPEESRRTGRRVPAGAVRTRAGGDA